MANQLIGSRSSWVWILGLLLAGIWFAATGNRAPSHSFNIKSVSIADAKALVEAGALVIDVRGEDQFGSRHIPGALPIPLEVLRVGIPAALASAKARPILVYCNEGLVHGPEGTDILNKAGFTQVVNLESGIEGWDRAGLPVERAK